jgi:hypothetical protein
MAKKARKAKKKATASKRGKKKGTKAAHRAFDDDKWPRPGQG